MTSFGDPRLPVRFWNKIRRSTNGCWHWTGFIDDYGYGRFSIGQGSDRSWSSHRWAFHMLVQELPDRRGTPGHLQVDHECHNRSKSCKGGPTCMHRRCVNPAHLRAVSARVNCLAGKTPAARNAAATHCSRGHEFVPENTYVTARGQRQCKRCQIDQSRENRRTKSALIDHGPHYQTVKTECPYGHPYSGDNLIQRPDGARSCRKCQAERVERYEARKRAGAVGMNARDRTHCPQGHPYSGGNLYIAPKSGTRGCRACRSAHGRARRAARRGG